MSVFLSASPLRQFSQCVHLLACGAIELLEEREGAVVVAAIFGGRFRRFRHFHGCPAGFGNIFEMPGSHGREQCHAKSGAFIGRHGGHPLSKDIGLQLPPEGAFRAAAGSANLPDGNPQFLDDGQAVT